MEKMSAEQAIELAKRMTREQASVMYRKMRAQRRTRIFALQVTEIARRVVNRAA